MSGVNGLVGSNGPLPKVSCSLHALGKPCPDSSTNTLKLAELPRNAIPVGMFSPEAKTDTVNPEGTLILGGRVGLKNAVLLIQSGAVLGFDTVPAIATLDTIRSSDNANTIVTAQ